MKLKRNRTVLALSILAVVIYLVALNWQTMRQWIEPGPTRLERPYGMAPVAFSAFVQACYDSKIRPSRIGQTIGDAPASVGYHKRDGVLKVKGRRIDYCAAVDLGVGDLDRAGINRFLHNLTKRGFACWYREKGKWKGREHVHAVYALLPMKPQLRGQVRLFLRERRVRKAKRLPWEKRVARSLR